MISAPPSFDPNAPAVEEPSIFDSLFVKGNGDYQYYRQPNGTIVSGRIGKNRAQETNHLREKWVPLTEYGIFDLHEHYLNAPFEVLFIRGGAKEMSLAQIMENGFHVNPPLVPRCGLQLGREHHARSNTQGHLGVCWQNARPVSFPQLAGKTFAKLAECPFCDREIFATVKQRLQHIRVMHREELNQMTLADAIAGRVQTAAVDGPDDTAALAAKRRAEEEDMNAKLLAMGVISEGDLADESAEDESEDVGAGLLAMSMPDDAPAPKRGKRS